MINTDCDAAMQQTLFMRELAASQQEGFRIKSFEYREYPALRFIGVNMDTKGHRPGPAEVEMVRILDSMKEYRRGFDYDMILYHHFGRGINKEPCHALAGGLWRRTRRYRRALFRWTLW